MVRHCLIFAGSASGDSFSSERIIDSAFDMASDTTEGLTEDLKKHIRSFYDACVDAIASQYSTIQSSLAGDLFVESVVGLMLSLDWTTDDIIFLLENNRYYDVPILFRSVLDGTARCLYLLSAPCKDEELKRFDEYLNVISKKEYASFEQPVANIRNSLRSCDTMEASIVDSLSAQIQQQKTGEGESRRVNEVAARWRFKELSNTLRKECPQWAASADSLELNYAMANPLVHKSGLGSRFLNEGINQIKTHYNSSAVVYAMPTLISSVVLLFDRLVIFSKRFNLDNRPFLHVMAQHIDVFTRASSVDDIARKVVRRQMEKG